MSDSVFICYARLDQDRVLQLAQALEERGITIWMDQWRIAAGANWDRAIDDAIGACSRFLIALSPAAVASEDAGEIGGELRRALDLRKDVVPVLLEPCEIPRQLLNVQYVDISAGLAGAQADDLAHRLSGGTMKEPRSGRLKLIHALQDLPGGMPVFDAEFTKAAAVELSKRL